MVYNLEYLIETYPNYKIVVIDALTYAGDLENLKAVKNAKNFTFVQGSICDRSLIQRIFQHYYIHDVIHLAAESHVAGFATLPIWWQWILLPVMTVRICIDVVDHGDVAYSEDIIHCGI